MEKLPPSTQEDFAEIADIEQRIATWLKQEVVEISHGFPARDGQDFFNLMFALLFPHGVSRIPIVGVRQGEQTKLYAQFSTGVQEHRRLVERAKLDPSKLEVVAVLENLPTRQKRDRNKRLTLNAKIEPNAEVVELHQEIALKSDFYTHVGWTQKGEDLIKKIFAHIGVIS